jgi:hypothetical protein
MFDELGRIGEKAIIAYFKALFQYLPRGTDEIQKTIVSIEIEES